MGINPKKPRKPRIDSISEHQRVFANASNVRGIPNHIKISAEIKPYFDTIIDEFSNAELTDTKLEMAARLAGLCYSLDKSVESLAKEGTVIKSAKGTPIQNPQVAVSSKLTASIVSLRRSLNLHGRAHGEDPRDVARRRAIEKQIEADARAFSQPVRDPHRTSDGGYKSLPDEHDISDDDLLAKPPSNE